MKILRTMVCMVSREKNKPEFISSLNFFSRLTTLNTHHAIYIVIDTIHPLANQSCYLQNGQLIMTQQSISIV